jgi:hypothetical protein
MKIKELGKISNLKSGHSKGFSINRVLSGLSRPRSRSKSSLKRLKKA